MQRVGIFSIVMVIHHVVGVNIQHGEGGDINHAECRNIQHAEQEIFSMLMV